MKFAHQFIEIACSHADAMALFADPLRLSEWAIAYCQSVEQTPKGYVANSVEGPRCFDVRADHETGIADIMSGATHDVLDDVLHVRVVPGGASLSLVSLIYAPRGEVSPEVLELMQTGLAAEAQQAKKLLEEAAAVQ